MPEKDRRANPRAVQAGSDGRRRRSANATYAAQAAAGPFFGAPAIRNRSRA